MKLRICSLSLAALSTAICTSLVTAGVPLEPGPRLFVTHEGVTPGGNNNWLVAVAPDPTFFIQTTSGFGSSLAVELAFKVEGSAIDGVFVNAIDWPYDNPGHNPFTDTVTFGATLSGENKELFTAFGGNVFLSGDPVPLFTMQTLGSLPTIIHYGVEASDHPTYGSTIAQTGENFVVGPGSFTEHLDDGGSGGGVETFYFTGYGGSVSSIPEPSSVLLAVAACVFRLSAGKRRR